MKQQHAQREHITKVKCKYLKALEMVTADMHDTDVCIIAGYRKNTIAKWRQYGKVTDIYAFEDMLNVCGYELQIKERQ